MTRQQLLDALTAERFQPIPKPNRGGCGQGPTALWAAVEAQRELWAANHRDNDEAERASA